MLLPGNTGPQDTCILIYSSYWFLCFPPSISVIVGVFSAVEVNNYSAEVFRNNNLIVYAIF